MQRYAEGRGFDGVFRLSETVPAYYSLAEGIGTDVSYSLVKNIGTVGTGTASIELSLQPWFFPSGYSAFVVLLS